MEGIIVVAAIAVAAFFAWKYRSKIKSWFSKAKDEVEDKIDDLKQ